MLIEATNTFNHGYEPPTLPIPALTMSRMAVQATRRSINLSLDTKKQESQDQADRLDAKAASEDLDERTDKTAATKEAAEVGATESSEPFPTRIDIIV